MKSSPEFAGIYSLTSDHPGFSCNYENLIVHSRTKTFEKQVRDSGLSIKMGIRGQEHYIFGKDRRTIGGQSYLVVNKHQEFICTLKSTEEVEALCFYLSPALVADVYATLTTKPELRMDQPELPPAPPRFFDRVYHQHENSLGLFLQQLRRPLLDESRRDLLDLPRIYYTLARHLVQDQLKVKADLCRLDAVRTSTKEELYRRLSRARHFIFDNYSNEIDLDQLAKVALLSKYHLLRSYKQIFGTTPYREVIRLRLEKARELLPHRDSIAEVAYELGFSDRRSFAKAFKRSFGHKPSTLQEQ